MNRTSGFGSILVGGLLLFSGLQNAGAECNVGDFKSKSASQMSAVQYLAYMSEISESQWNNVNHNVSGEGHYFVIGGSGSYADAQSQAKTALSKLQLSSNSSGNSRNSGSDTE